MQDEAFHLTPLDVRRYDFGSALRGYDKVRVDQFRDQVAEELERLSRLTADLEAKARSFHEQLRAFRERDKALNEALVSAQQLRGEIRDQADREAQLLVREARAEGDRIIDDARAEVRRMQTEVDALERMKRSYMAQLRALITRQLMELEAAEQTMPDMPALATSIGAPMNTVAPPTPRPSLRAEVAMLDEDALDDAPSAAPSWIDQSVDE
jgi:DivIVA domain-containing protein